MSDHNLGAYLRARREAVAPAEVGLPGGGRRRTPGLRRSELATLAGISVDYLVRLEQGRDRHPSAQVLAALADALGLTADERLQLHLLAKAARGDGQLLCPGAEPPGRTVRPPVRALLERLEPTPALVLNRLSEVLAHTTGFTRLAGATGLLDARPPSLVRFVFTDPRARAAYPEWARVADQQVAGLRFASPGDDPHLAGLVEELTVTAGAAFSARWAAPPVPLARSGVERLAHPEAGELRLAYETLELPEDQRLVVHLPADDASAVALDRLTGRRPGALRAVNG